MKKPHLMEGDVGLGKDIEKARRGGRNKQVGRREGQRGQGRCRVREDRKGKEYGEQRSKGHRADVEGSHRCLDAADCGHECRVWICVPRALAGVASDFQPVPCRTAEETKSTRAKSVRICLQTA